MYTVTLFTVKDDPEVYFVTTETETTISCKLLNKLEENCLADFIFNKDQVCASLEVDLKKVTELFNVAASFSLLSSEEVKFDNFITKNVAFRFNGYIIFTKDDNVIVESVKDDNEFYLKRKNNVTTNTTRNIEMLQTVRNI